MRVGALAEPKSLSCKWVNERSPLSSISESQELIDGFYELFPQNYQRHCWIFIDEVQNSVDWSSVLRRLLDTKKVSLFITGSSSKLLSKEIATILRGRAIATEVWPFDLQEYALARVQEAPAEIMSPRKRDEYLAFFDEYLLAGGFPETVNYTVYDQRRIHQDYVSVAILRDILERHEVKNEHLLRYLIKFIMTNVSKPISFNKLFNDLKSQGRPIGKNTLYQYFEYISDCFLSFLIPLYTESTRKQESNPRKAYAVDTGLANSHMIGNGENKGKLFENLLYLDLRRKNYEIYYYLTHSGKEVDFVVKSIDGEVRLVQACYDMTDADTQERETSALNEAEKELGLQGVIITRKNYPEFLSTFNQE